MFFRHWHSRCYSSRQSIPEVAMSVPIVPMLSLASGILGVLNKALDKTQGQGFEGLLAGLTDASQGVGTGLLAGLTARLGIQDGKDADLLASTEAGAMVLQLIAALREAGLGAADIQALLTGGGGGVSDEALKKILLCSGLSEPQIQAVMADKGFLAELKHEIVRCFQSAVGTQTPAIGVSTGQGEGVPSGPPTAQTAQGAEEKADSVSRNDSAADGLDVPQKLAEAICELVRAATKDDDTLDAVLKEVGSRGAAVSAADLNSTLVPMIQQALKRAETKNQNRVEVNVASVDETQSDGVWKDAALTNALNTLRETVGIKNDTLEKLFLSTDQSQRQTAVDEVTDHVAAYFKAQGDKPVSPEVKHALSLVRSATTKEEWSAIESGIKLWRPDFQVPDAKLTFDRGAFTSLTAKLTGSDAGPLYDRYVDHAIDQIRIQIPSQLNGGEGTATMRLNPPLLGRVDVTLAMEDGALQATIRSDSQITRDMLQLHISTLKDALAEQGIRVSQLSIASGLDYRHNQQQDPYAQFQQGRFNGDGQGRSSHQNQGGGPGRDSGNGMYSDTPSHGYRTASGGLDLFA